MECNIEYLPSEVLAHIFSFLDWRDKLNVSSTCKHLMNALNYCPGLLDDVCVEMRSSNFESGFQIFSTTSRNFSYFSFRGVDINVKLLGFVEKLAPLCRRLHFESGEMTDEDSEISRRRIENCDNLRELYVTMSRAFMMFSRLPKLKTLCVDQVYELSSLELSHIQNMAPATLIDFSMNRHRDIEPGTLYRFLDEFIRERCRTLQSLDLSWNKMESTDFVELSRIKGLKLRSVGLPEFSKVKTDDLLEFEEFQGVVSFCSNQRTIMDMTCALDLDDATLATLCNTLPQLEGLALILEGVMDRNLSPIFKMKRLQELSITDNFCITPDSFFKALDGFSCHGLKHLDLSFTMIDDEVMYRLLPLVAANLRELILDVCHEITDNTVFAISKWLTSLRVLEICSCPNISNDGLLGQGSPEVPLSNIKGLEVLVLNDCSDHLTEDGLLEAIRFEHLVELDLTDAVEITESGRMTLMKNNPKLRTLKTIPTVIFG